MLQFFLTITHSLNIQKTIIKLSMCVSTYKIIDLKNILLYINYVFYNFAEDIYIIININLIEFNFKLICFRLHQKY